MANMQRGVGNSRAFIYSLGLNSPKKGRRRVSGSVISSEELDSSGSSSFVDGNSDSSDGGVGSRRTSDHHATKRKKKKKGAVVPAAAAANKSYCASSTTNDQTGMFHRGFIVPKGGDDGPKDGLSPPPSTLSTVVALTPTSSSKRFGKVANLCPILAAFCRRGLERLNEGSVSMAKFFSPHIALAAITVIYMMLGALVFQALEEKVLDDMTEKNRVQIEHDQKVYLERLWQLANTKGVSREDAKRLIRPEYERYVEAVYTAHRFRPKEHTRSDKSRRAMYLNGTFTESRWSYETAVSFTATMLTSIGYGFIVPYTTWGRMFSVFYGMIGVPLTLVSVANVAKFFSEMLFWIHQKILVLWYKWKFRDKQEDEEIEGILGGGTIGEILDQTKLVRFPSIIMFLIIVAYGWLAAHLIGQTEPEWTFMESLYFTFISILTVGFGDYKPTPDHWVYTFILVVIGVVFGTMCMDTVGSFYLREIHYLGRRLRQTSNPFDLLRQAKVRRQRRQMTGLLESLAKGLVFQDVKSDTMTASKRRKKKKKRRRPSLSDKAYMFARQAPDPPRDFTVVSTSAYSARLRWTPAFSHTTAEVAYDLRYRFKLEEKKDTRVVRNLRDCQYELMNLQSCSLYEFSVVAVNQFGVSKAVSGVQYTEPALSPQHIVADKLHANCIRLSWEAPFKRTDIIKHYVVYYTDDLEAELSQWNKMVVYAQHVVFDDLRYDWFYQFSVRAVFLSDDPNSPLSRALFVKTDILEFNPRSIGHSKTIEIMEALSQRVHEKTPLLRETISFAC